MSTPRSTIRYAITFLFAPALWATSGTLPVTADMTLTEDHTGTIVVAADNINLNCDGHTVNGQNNPINGIEVIGREGVTVQNCTVTQVGKAFSIIGTRRSTFRNNHATGNSDEGFDLESSSNNVFINNRVDTSHDGWDVEDSDANLFLGNDASRNADNGLEFDSCNDNVLINNVANLNGGNGFSFDASNRNKVNNNRADSNQRRGFEIDFASNDNTFTRNDACGNQLGDARQNPERPSYRNIFLGNNFCTPENISYLRRGGGD